MAPPSGLVCPMCGTANKMESVFCQSCGARLVPLTAAPVEEKQPPAAVPIKGLSLPALESPGELPAELQKIQETPAPPAPVPSGKMQDESLIEQLRAASVDAEPVADEDVPDWLTAVNAPASAPSPAEPALTPVEIPAWLQQIRPAAIPNEEPAAGMIDDVDAPDWLKQTDAEAEPATPFVVMPMAQEPQPEPPIELPVAPIESEPVTQEPVPTITPATAQEIPAWLSELKSKSAEPPDVEPAQDAHFTDELMQTLEASETPGESTAQPAWSISSSSTASSEDEDIPDWLRTLPATSEIGAEPFELLVGAEQVPELQPALPGEVPDWLASLNPSAQLVEDESTEMGGPLEGMRGILPLALAVTEPHVKSQPVPAVAHQDSARLFESILAAPGQDTAAPTKTKRRAWTIRPLIYLLIALAVLIPFFIPSDLAGSLLDISGAPAKFYNELALVPANAPVLVSFDYDPSQASEMDLQATAILRYLVQRRIKIITISTLDTGAPLAKRILDSATLNAKEYGYGANYVNLGYLPGSEAALSKLATEGFSILSQDVVTNQPLSKSAGFTNVKTLRDVSLIIELAGTETALKMWMEQVQPRTPTKIVAGVSAGVEPKARAYAAPAAKQLTAMISGLVGAAQYEILSNQPGQALVSVNAQSAAQLVFVFVIVIGNLVLLFSRGRKQNA